jgi:non-specific protein-tyrosine kinase
MNDFIELRRILTIVLRRWWWLVIATGLAALLGNIISRQQTPVYQATTTILVGDSIKSSHVDRVDIQVSEALVQTYVEIARRQPVLQGVVTALNLNQSWQSLNDQIQVTLIESTQLIEIVVEASSPEMARMIADEVVNQMILLSPASSEGRDNEAVNSFNREQIQSLQQRIVAGQNRLVEIDTAMSQSISEIELGDLQREKATLQGLIVEWERNYTELLVLTEPKRNPTQLTVIESAHSNNRQIRPRVQLNTILAGVVGLVLALGIIFLLEFLDDTYKSLSDFSQSEEVNILGSIRKIKGRKPADKIVAHLNPYSPVTESYRIVRSRIRFKPTDKPARSIMVTSSMPAEGKSVTVANLATVFAQANYKTIIVDADLRHPILHEVFNVSNEVGLGDMLSSPEIKIEDCLKTTSVNNLQILTSGMPLLDPSERLGSTRMEEILNELNKVAEIVILDSPPVLVFADAIVLSRRIDGVIVVIQAGKSKRAAITQTLFDLQNANANLLGSIFNQSPKSDTFSVNKAYMQERPQLPSPVGLAKKENAGGGKFHDLRDVARPLSGNMKLDDREVGVDTTQSEDLAKLVEREHTEEVADLGDAATPPSENMRLDSEKDKVETSQFYDLEYAAALLESTEPDIKEVSIEETSQTHDLAEVEPVVTEHTEEVADLHDAVSPIPEGLEAELKETIVEETHFHDLTETAEPEDEEKVVDLSEGATVKEIAAPQNAKFSDVRSRKRKSRKNRKNGHKNEEISDGQIRPLIDHEDSFPKNGKTYSSTDKETNTSVDQTTILVDQTKE